MKKRILSIILLIAAIAALSSCSSSKSVDLFAMNTVMSITVYGKNANSCINEIQDKIKQLDSLFSVTDEKSEIYKINRSDTPVKVSPDTENITLYAKEMSRLTDGAFDITIRQVSKLWGFTDSKCKVPSQTEIDDALKLVGNDTLDISDGDVFCKGDIDLGGIAKGYAAGCIRIILKKYNVQSAVVSLGGNILVYGKKPDGEGWSVGITHPQRTDEIIGLIKVSDTAVVTSGGYERNFTENGKTYHHILDPKTGYPADSGIISATIVTTNDSLADALSTAVYVMGVEKAVKLWQNHKSFDMILVTDSAVYVTADISEQFTLSDKNFEIKILK